MIGKSSWIFWKLLNYSQWYNLFFKIFIYLMFYLKILLCLKQNMWHDLLYQASWLAMIGDILIKWIQYVLKLNGSFFSWCNMFIIIQQPVLWPTWFVFVLSCLGIGHSYYQKNPPLYEGQSDTYTYGNNLLLLLSSSS